MSLGRSKGSMPLSGSLEVIETRLTLGLESVSSLTVMLAVTSTIRRSGGQTMPGSSTTWIAGGVVSPLKPSNWWAANGEVAKTCHRRCGRLAGIANPVGQHVVDPQRFGQAGMDRLVVTTGR